MSEESRRFRWRVSETSSYKSTENHEKKHSSSLICIVNYDQDKSDLIVRTVSDISFRKFDENDTEFCQ